MYEVFMDSHAYSYKAVNKYNIPYAMIRYQEAISIYHTFLFDSPMSEIVKDRINCNSKYFEIIDKEIVKKGSGFYNIGIYFTKYQSVVRQINRCPKLQIKTDFLEPAIA